MSNNTLFTRVRQPFRRRRHNGGGSTFSIFESESDEMEHRQVNLKLGVDLHSLLFLATLHEFDYHLRSQREDMQGEDEEENDSADASRRQEAYSRIKNVTGIKWTIYIFSVAATVIQSYFVYSSFASGDWKAAKAATFYSGDVQELKAERLLASLLLYFFVMPEAVSGVRILLVWFFLYFYRLPLTSISPGQRTVTSAPPESEKRKRWVLIPMRALTVIAYLAKISLCMMTAILAVTVCYSSPDEEGVQGIVMDFTGLLIILEIDNFMVPFALEVAEQFGGVNGVSLADMTDEFLDNYKIRFTDPNLSRKYRFTVRLAVRIFLVLTSLGMILLLVFENLHFGKCHAKDIEASWTGPFMTMSAHLCPESHPEGERCLNWDLYRQCSHDSSFCRQLMDGTIQNSSVHLDETNCYAT